VSHWLKRSHTEISELDIVIPVEEDVFRFQVAMADVESMAVPKTSDDLAEQTHSLLFW
jgi:hypothetical protein